MIFGQISGRDREVNAEFNDQTGSHLKSLDARLATRLREGVDAKSKLNPNLNSPNIKALLGELHTALRKTAKSDRDVLNKAFPSKYGNDVVSALKFKSVPR